MKKRASEVSKSRDQATVIILAAGQGTRLEPITRWLPKPLVPVNGQPILVTNLRNLASAGFRKAVVVYGQPSALIPDFLAEVDCGPISVEFALQKEQRGTGDAFLTGAAHAADSPYHMLMVGDTIYTEEDIAAVWERFAGDGVDGCIMLKELPFHKLGGSSLVVLGDDGMIVDMIPKPSAAEIREHGSHLVDASLHVYRNGLQERLSKIPLSRTNELEVTAGLVHWIREGAKIAGVPRPAPTHVTHLEDFIIHNVAFGAPLVALTEIEDAVVSGSDKDISGYLRVIDAERIPFAYRRLTSLSRRPMDHTKQGRALAIISELFRHHASCTEWRPKPEFDELTAQVEPEDVIQRLEGHLAGGASDPAVYHYLAVAYARRANSLIGAAVFADAQSRLTTAEGPVTFREGVRVQTPARLAFSSSQGSDISYIIEEKSAVILNCAITVQGACPGSITVERIPEYQIELNAENRNAAQVVRHYDDIFGHLSTDDPLVLLKAGLRFSGVINREHAWSLADWLKQRGAGVRVTLGCSVPISSGLGCSGILASGLIRGLREFCGLATSPTELLTRSYCCERLYGRSGYQDIIGGSLGGVKLIEADASTGLFDPHIDALTLGPEQLAAIPENVLVFHTGRPHNPNPYLLTIPAKYFTRAGDYMYAYENGKQLTHAMAEALRKGDWATLGGLVEQYWDDRESFEDGVTPENAARLRKDLRKWCYGTALCGSGHGGYMMAVLQPGHRQAVLRHLAQNGIPGEAVLDYELTDQGIVVG